MSHGMREAVIREQEAESILSHHKRGRGGKVKDTRAKALSAFQKRQAAKNATFPARAAATLLALIATAALASLAYVILAAILLLTLPPRYAGAAILATLFLFVFDLYRIARRRARGRMVKESSK